MNTTSKAAGRATASIIVIGDDTNDNLQGDSGADTLNGRGGNDYLAGYGGNDQLNGGDGTDTAYFSGYYAEYLISYDTGTGRYTATDSVASRGGTDTVTGVEYFAFWDGTVVAAPKSLGIVVFASSTTGDTLQGGNGDDSLYANVYSPYHLVGGAGNDLLYGYGSYDNVAVFSGNSTEYVISRDSFTGTYVVTDTMAGRDGKDTLYGYFATIEFADTTVSVSGIGSYYGTYDPDTLTGTLADEYFYGSGGNDTLNGNGGTDRAAYSGRYAEYIVTFDAAAGSYTVFDKINGRDATDTLLSIEKLSFYDITVPIGPSAGGQVVLGTDSNDTLTGGAGDDSLYGGKYGNDTLTGGGGNDVLQGGGGAMATAVFSGAYADYVITYDGSSYLYTVTDKMSGRDGTDYLSSIDLLRFADVTLPIATSPGGQNLTGTTGPDTLTGGDGNDSLNGGRGSDTLNGGNGTDVLQGAEGNDRLDAGTGNDWLTGGKGNDTLIGRGGSDTAVYSGNFADYQIVYNAANSTYKITDLVADRDGVDTVHSVEFLQFLDGTQPIAPTLVGTASAGGDFAGVF